MLGEFQREIKAGIRPKSDLERYYYPEHEEAGRNLEITPILVSLNRIEHKLSTMEDLMEFYGECHLRLLPEFVLEMYKRGRYLPAIALNLFAYPVYQRVRIVQLLADFYLGRPEQDEALHFMLYESYPDLTPEEIIEYAMPDQRSRLQKITTLDIIPLLVTPAMLSGIEQRRPKEFKL